MIDKALSYIAPHHCYVCSETGPVICDNCKYNIINDSLEVCIGCGKVTQRNGVCGTCHVPYSRAWVVDTYKGPIGEAIKGMKIVAMREVATVLGDMLAETLPSLPVETIIVPVPTSRSHVRQRGFDHTRILATTVAKRLHIPVGFVLQRVGQSTQRGATAVRRRRQAKEAFRVDEKLDPDKIYLLIDDVVTTGSTVIEASKRLREAGASEVWVAVLARETLD